MGRIALPHRKADWEAKGFYFDKRHGYLKCKSCGIPSFNITVIPMYMTHRCPEPKKSK